ncbi:arrestin domain-containing protein 17-like [Daphnia pulicaria]|uniref:arrestin domain-containing protein 17-like n=1 Tax=Daphnia pulicaria TaxID=35523 RepID=UPI001EE9B0DD|nr:arrestin domain-containing protein 17-like [Daphnia pulicaria]
MGIKRLAIRLDPVENPTSSSRVYSPGDIVSGYVAIDGSGIVSINGLYLEVEGRAKVAWNKNDNTYRAQNSYMQLTIPLIHDSLYLQETAGGLKFPFKFTLPREIPSSYEGKSGNIRYSIKAVIKRRSFLKFDYVSQVSFTVNAVVDLGKDVTTLFPLRQSVSKPRSGLKRIMADVWLDRTGYVPGEKIQFNANIDNYSGKSVRGTTVQLIQYTTFTDGKHKNRVKTILWQRKGRKIRDKEIQVWDRMAIVVPFVPPSGMPFCSLIDISYVIKLIIDPGFFHGNVVMRLDIIIGSVRNPNVDEGRHSRNVTSAIFPPSSSVVSPDRTSTGVLSCNECQHVDSPPPTYEECELTGFSLFRGSPAIKKKVE